MAKQHLVENFSKDWGEPLNIKQLALNESEKIVEANGKKYNVNNGYEVPVWRLDKKNLNERVYSKSLGESVVRNNKSLVTANLADHPEGDSDGSVKDILAISKNPHIRGDILYVDSYPVDEAFEKKLAKMVEHGAGLGVSSSCYGDVDSEGFVVEEGFEVVRFFDFVNSPSYEVFITNDSIKEAVKKPQHKFNSEFDGLMFKDVKQSDVKKIENILDDEDILFETIKDGSYYQIVTDLNHKDTQELKIYKDLCKQIEDVTGYKVFDYYINESVTKIPIEEKKNMPDDKVKELLAKTTKLNIDKMVEEASKIEKISDKISALEEAVSYVSEDFLPELKTSIDEKIETLRAESLELAEKGKLVDQLNENLVLKESEKEPLNKKIEDLETENEDLEKELDTLEDELEELKEHAKKAEQLLEASDAEVGSRFTSAEYIELIETVEKLKDEKKCAEEDADDAEDEVEDLEKELSEAKARNRKFKKKISILEEKNAQLQEAINDYTAEIEDGLMNEEDPDTYDSEEFDYDTYLEPTIGDVDGELELDMQDDEVTDYYEDLVDEDPRYESVKDVILGCKTILEAQRTALRLRSTIEKLPSNTRRKRVVVQKKFEENEANVANIQRQGWL